MADDCFLPGLQRIVPDITLAARLTASEPNADVLRNGIDRPLDGQSNSWPAPLGAWVAYEFDQPTRLRRVRLVFDSDLNRRQLNMPSRFPLDAPPRCLPSTVVRSFRLQIRDQSGSWQTCAQVKDNYLRLVRIDLDISCQAVRLVIDTSWGANPVQVFSFDVE